MLVPLTLRVPQTFEEVGITSVLMELLSNILFALVAVVEGIGLALTLSITFILLKVSLYTTKVWSVENVGVWWQRNIISCYSHAQTRMFGNDIEIESKCHRKLVVLF